MTEFSTFPGRLGIQQRVLPIYRREFFDTLAEYCKGGVSIFAGEVHAEESIPTINQLNTAKFVKARNLHFGKIQSPYYFLWQGGLIDWIADWNPDVLIVEANPRYLSSGRAIKWMQGRTRPVIGWGLGAPPIEKQTNLIGRIESYWRIRSRKKLIERLDAVIAYSQKGAVEYSSITRASNKIYTATNSVTKRPDGSPPERSPHFVDRANVLFVGRLQSRKRIDNLLKACASLPKNLQPQLKIIGDGPERDSLVKMAESVYPSAEFPGSMHGAEIKKYFIEADLFVLPGTGGLAVQEAMTYGLPVIVSEGDGTQADMVRPENGWLIPANDEVALKAALEEALLDAARLREMGNNSFRIVQDEINIEQMVNIFIKVLNLTNYSVDHKS